MRCLTALLRRLIASRFVMRHGRLRRRSAGRSAVKGLFLLTDYPSQTVRAGEVTTIRVKLRTPACRPSRWRCRCQRRAGRLEGRHPGRRPARRRGDARHQPGCQPAAARRRAEGCQARLAEGHGAAPRARSPRRPTCVLTLTVATEAPAKLSHQVAPAVAARHAALVVRIHGDGRQRQRQGPDGGAVGAGAGQLPDHLHRGLRLQRDQLDPDRGRPDQGHQGQGDAAARREGGRLSGAGQGRRRGRHGRAARDPADQRPGQARALDQGRAPVAARPRSARPSTYTLVVTNDGTAPIEEVEMSGTRADQLEGRVQPQDHRERGAQREEGGAGRW